MKIYEPCCLHNGDNDWKTHERLLKKYTITWHYSEDNETEFFKQCLDDTWKKDNIKTLIRYVEKLKERINLYENNRNCHNCINCYNCINCTNCTNCVNSIDCKDCNNCVNCELCENCNNCTKCIDCENFCIECNGCKNCTNCIRCVYSTNCSFCIKCDLCIFCQDSTFLLRDGGKVNNKNYNIVCAYEHW